ncbi:MAG: hypothetical protein V1774_01360 [Candidatus Eisenbacteria bacterium]
MKNHVTLVGVMHLAFGALGILTSLVVAGVLLGAGILSGEEESFAILSLLAYLTTGFVFVLSLPAVIGGIGLLKRRPWARVMILIVAVLDLINIPLGTAMGIYSLWVLLHSETEGLFAAPARPST